jgi:CheY-like chemotaxis protein
VQHWALARQIAERLDAGRLPREQPPAMRVGYGGWRRCDGCDELILAAQVEYELQYADDRSCRLHAGCYGIWDEARRDASGLDDARGEDRAADIARRVVIIEDDDALAAVLQFELEGYGHDTVIAHDGERGIELINRHRPDVALVDLGLGIGIDGCEVARRLRASGQKLYLVALTGYGDEQDRARALDAGFDLHFLKPGEPGELVRVVASSPPRPEAGEDRSLG